MPKKVDHDERRRHIAEAVLRVAGRDGLDGATLRDVAVEAGISLGSVQHYFRNKDEMLRYVVGYLGEQVTARIVAGMRDHAAPGPVRSFLLSMAAEMLPLDDRRRAERRAGQAFTARAVDVPELGEALRYGDRWLHGRVAELIGRGGRDGELRPELDAEREAVVLLAMIEGLATDILLGMRDPGEATETVRYHLDRLTPQGS
ncbi:TetR family transcriptional regulator C-terminal domain-containing protein [Nonomuraea sp. K274]|uniref:TetR family transcriptional regulator C-terminal domain-containing protein n=1 Tax=Nonomuraea cypriaca TaxID=1187855 RepID=A0A931F3K0_9ACTN|nr:TetR/AcrR family transcriptional regulator [Nonomuraea cypriaca]MBF8191707.1 TetR family transcriptional regulator C-terminal domain-containing protein [Nonomuraea cypriaca]